jgi:hypothetical protein
MRSKRVYTLEIANDRKRSKARAFAYAVFTLSIITSYENWCEIDTLIFERRKKKRASIGRKSGDIGGK